MRRIARGEPCPPAASAPERRKRQPGRPDPLELGLDVVHAKADVVQALAVRLEPGRERVGRIERLDELEIGVPEVEVREPHGYIRRLVDRHDAEPDPVAEVAERGLGVGDDHGHVIERADHALPPAPKARSLAATTRSMATDWAA